MKYRFLSSVKFYLSLAYYNIVAPLECNNLRLKVFLNEFFWLFIVSTRSQFTSKYKQHIVLKTKFGNFFIRDTCWDLKVASPSFERQDLQELINRVSHSLTLNHNVVFIDIGAQFGKYSIIIGNKFKKYSRKLTIFAFEPEPQNYKLLKENVRLNKLTNVKMFQRALSDKRKIQKFYYFKPQNMIVSYVTPTKISIRTDLLDAYCKYFSNLKNVDLYIKLDVEGHETEVLRGSLKTIKKATTTTLMVEDSVSVTSQKLLRYLTSHGTFLTKRTEYNSFWRLSHNL